MIQRLFIFGIIAIVLFSPGLAWAHVAPVQYEPLPGVRLERMPEVISIRFNGRVEAQRSSVIVTTKQGSVSGGTLEGDRLLLLSPLPLNVSGPVTVTWQVISAEDGHLTKGSYLFAVGKALPEGQPIVTVEHRSSIWETVFIFLELLGQSIALGLLLVWWLGWPQLQVSLSGKSYLKPLAIVGAVAVVLMAVGTLGYLVWTGSWSTVAGGSAGYRLLLAIVMLVVGGVYFRRIFTLGKRQTVLWLMMVSLVVLAIILRARVSHAAAGTFYPELSVAINALHLVAKEFLIGSYVVLVFVMSVIWKHLAGRERLQVLKSWWRTSLVAVALGGVTGVYVTWLHLKDVGNLLVTRWGIAFLPVAIFGGIFFVAHLFNYWQMLGMAANKSSSQFSLGYSMPLAMVAGLWILFLSSALIITKPPAAGMPNAVLTYEAGETSVSLSRYRFDTSKFLISLDGAFENASLIVLATNEAGGVSKLQLPVVCIFEGDCLVDSQLLVTEGSWVLDVVARRVGGYDVVARFSLAELFEREVNESRIFTWLSVLLAIVIALVSVALYIYSSNLAFKNEIASFSLNVDRSWLFWIFISAILFNGVTGNHGSHQAFIKSRFQKDCETRGYSWQEAPPMRESRITSTQSFLGCSFSLGGKQYHLIEDREYFYLLHK